MSTAPRVPTGRIRAGGGFAWNVQQRLTAVHVVAPEASSSGAPSRHVLVDARGRGPVHTVLWAELSLEARAVCVHMHSMCRRPRGRPRGTGGAWGHCLGPLPVLYRLLWTSGLQRPECLALGRAPRTCLGHARAAACLLRLGPPRARACSRCRPTWMRWVQALGFAYWPTGYAGAVARGLAIAALSSSESRRQGLPAVMSCVSLLPCLCTCAQAWPRGPRGAWGCSHCRTPDRRGS